MLIITCYYCPIIASLFSHYYLTITSCNNGMVIIYYYIGLFHYYVIITYYVINSHHYILWTVELADGSRPFHLALFIVCRPSRPTSLAPQVSPRHSIPDCFALYILACRPSRIA